MRILLFIGAAAIFAVPPALAQRVTVAEQIPAAGEQQSVLASAKNLYASASYEAALLELSEVDGKDDADQVDTYRALCFLALDRQGDAEQTLENILTRRPLYAMNEAETSPRLVAMFRNVRKRALPGVAQQLYVAAKVEYEGKNYASAVSKFTQLISALNDPDVSDQSGKLADLKELADGFLKLSEQKLVDAAPASVTPTPSAPPVAPPPSPVHPAVDAGIQPPIVIDQTMPDWKSPDRYRPYSGRLELVIDEQGAVERATIVRSIWPTYDVLLLRTAKRWRYEPALRDGKPVRAVKVLDITVGTSP